MGYGTTIIIIMLFVNVIVFLGASATGQSEINPPIINTLVSVATGNYLSLIPNLASFIGASGTVLGLIIIGMIAMSVATGSTYITGGGGYGATQIPMLVGVFIFTSLALIPNFTAMGFPNPVDTVLYAIFGLMIAIGLYGIIRGE